MKPFHPAKFAPSALDERFDADMEVGFEAMHASRCTTSEIETALAGGPLDKLDAAAFADPCQRYPLPPGPLTEAMILDRLQLLLFRGGTGELHEHMEMVFEIAPIVDRDPGMDWGEQDCSETDDDLQFEKELRDRGLTKRLWDIATVHEPFVRAMLEGDLGLAWLVGSEKFESGLIAHTGETVPGIVEDVAPLWLFANLQMGANACRLRRDEPPQMPFWAEMNAQEVPRLFRAINEMKARIAKFEQVKDLYYRDLRRPVENFAIPAPAPILGSNGWLASSSAAALTITLSRYGSEASASEVASFEADGTADEARSQLTIWRKEHGDNLDAFIEFRMSEADRTLRRMRKRLERLQRFKGLSNLDLASYNQTRPRARLVLACEQAAAWLPPPILPSEQKPAKGKLKPVETEYRERPSPIRQAIEAITVAVGKFGSNEMALASADFRIPRPGRSTAKRARDLNYLFANLIVEGMPQDELIDGWDEATTDNEAFVRRTQPDRQAARYKKQFKKQPTRGRHHKVDIEARGSLEWRFRQGKAPGLQTDEPALSTIK